MTTSYLGDRAAKQLRRIRSAEALRRMRRAFEECVDGALQAAYSDARWRTRGLRLALAILESVFPISRIVEVAGEVNQQIRQQGLSEAVAASARLLGLKLEFALSDDARTILSSHPVIVYGNHPTILTPFLVAAAAGREDIRLLTVDELCRLIPGLGSYVFPLRIQHGSNLSEWRRGGINRVITRRLAGTVMKKQDREEARLANQRALSEGVRHLKQGGCIVIFPGGGGRKEGRWYPGIGRMIEEIRRHHEAQEVYLMRVHEDTRSDALLHRGRRRLHRANSREGETPLPVRVRFANPCRLQELIPPGMGCDEIVRILQADYEATFSVPENGSLSRFA